VRLLIIGLGFIATEVAYFLSKGHEVTVTYRALNPVKEKYVKILQGEGVRAVKLDVLKESEKLEGLVSDSDVVVNFVGEISGTEEGLRASNVEVPKAIAEAVRKRGRLMIHASASTYGLTGYVKAEEKLGEGLRPSTPFERTKLEGELEVYRALGERAIIMRPTLVYGRFNAHVQFVQIYKLVKLGIVPKLDLTFMPVSARYLALAVDAVAKGRKPSKNYFYATECEPVSLSRFFEVFARALNKKAISLPVPQALAKLALPSYVRNLLKYAGTRYDCSVFKELVPDLKFDEEEVSENASFLQELEREGILIPT
jgi:dTDP-4-dehydrorhamnose reductase